MLPRVTITGLMRSASMRSALTAPTAAPVATAASIATPDGRPETSTMPAATAEASTTEPTERSIPPTSTTSDMPRPSSSTGAVWRRMFSALPNEPKTGEVATKADEKRESRKQHRLPASELTEPPDRRTGGEPCRVVLQRRAGRLRPERSLRTLDEKIEAFFVARRRCRFGDDAARRGRPGCGR